MKNILRLGAILFAITAVAGFLLGLVSSLTEGPIAELQARMQVQAMQETLPKADRFEDLEVPAGHPLVASVSVGYSGDQVAGWDLIVTPSGYGGTLSIMVGVLPGGEIQGIKVLSHTETPGLGANSARPEFAQQFAGKRGPLSVTKGGSDGDSSSSSSGNEADATSSASEAAQPSSGDTIQALTGATVTSNAVVSGVNAAITLAQELEQGAASGGASADTPQAENTSGAPSSPSGTEQ